MLNVCRRGAVVRFIARLSASNAGTSTRAAVDKIISPEDVRFRTDMSDRMTVPVLLAGQGLYRFLVDRRQLNHDLASDRC